MGKMYVVITKGKRKAANKTLEQRFLEELKVMFEKSCQSELRQQKAI